MTAPDLPTFYVSPDADGTPVLWGELGGPDPQMVAYRDGDRIHIVDTQADRIWSVLTAVLAPDEATIERLAKAILPKYCLGKKDGVCQACVDETEERTRAVLAALGAAAPAERDGEVGE